MNESIPEYSTVGIPWLIMVYENKVERGTRAKESIEQLSSDGHNLERR